MPDAEQAGVASSAELPRVDPCGASGRRAYAQPSSTSTMASSSFCVTQSR